MFEYINKMNSRFSPQIIEYKKRPRHMVFEIQVLAWDMHIIVAELSQLMES